MSRLTIPMIKNRRFKEKIVCITAYSARVAEIIDPHTDIILVGDSLGMTLHGLDSTVQVTLDMMILAAQAVGRKRKNALMIVDMPYGTYEGCHKLAYQNAALIMQQTQADGVKLEGGSVMASTIVYLTQRNIPVMGHIGLIPQSVSALGGYSARGKTHQEVKSLINDMQAISQSGCFSLVLEGVKQDVAEKMLKYAHVPVIGIGASPLCDGQVLVSDDLVGLTSKTAKFVKQYAQAGILFDQAVLQFSQEVKQGTFPSKEYLYA